MQNEEIEDTEITPQVETTNTLFEVVAIGRTERSKSIDKLAAALAKAQSKMELAKKDAKNPYFKSNYADLSSVIRAAKEPLSENQLAVSQILIPHKSKAVVTTMLIHSSGQYLTSTIALSPKQQDPQSFGSAVTYARRYSYQAIIGLSAEDDDGNSAAGKKTETVKPTPAPAPAPIAKITQFQIDTIAKLLVQKGKTSEELEALISKGFKLNKVEDLSIDQASKVITKIRALPDPVKPEEATEDPRPIPASQQEEVEDMDDLPF